MSALSLVAPFTGAWIETGNHRRYRRKVASPPSRGRGLKLYCGKCHTPKQWSPPSRGRGLKLRILYDLEIMELVAPFAGAWIETLRLMKSPNSKKSPPSRGRGLKHHPHADRAAIFWSPPSRGRGLKRVRSDEGTGHLGSPPSRGRGLKLIIDDFATERKSRPLHGGVD